MNKRNCITIAISAVMILAAGWFVWNKTASATKIALINFQQFQTTSLIKANSESSIKYEVVTVDDLDRLGRYDCVMAFGMGLNVSADQRMQLRKAAAKGIPVLVYAATNPENNICNMDSVHQNRIIEYLKNGNRRNYRNLALYIRENIDRKNFFVKRSESPVESASDVLYHLDDEVSFTTVEEYESYLKKINSFRPDAPKVAIIGGFNDPFSGNRDNIDSMIVVFQNSGLNVYPVSSAMKRLDFLKQIRPDAVVYNAHGRLNMGKPDDAVEWLKEMNIPVFCPLTLLQTEEAWNNDPMGMFGGFMSQSVVMPELDGAIYPYVINTQEKDENGLYLFKAVPERLNQFTEIINNFISLKRKNNSEKKLAIYYFKGAGQETLTAQGLETVPSLYNLLKRLRSEGYKVENLPSTEEEFEKMLLSQGSVLSTYAKGAFDEFLQNGRPALVEKSEYESWTEKSLPKEMYSDVTELYGEAPGDYMSVHKDGKDYLTVANINFGNVVLLPQPMAALGSDAFAIVHGAKSAPPHTYIIAYLWSQYAFQADALLHFGAHGSLEFTPHKQVALSNHDWPDRLVGTTPHFYYYTIGNIGESMMAKRRAYSTIISYLTQPFMDNETRGQYRELQNKIQSYYKADENTVDKASLGVKKIAVEMGLHRDLRLDSVLTSPYSQEDIERIENFAEELSNEKMTGQLYTTGVPYAAERIESTILAMCADPIAYSLAALDRQKGKITEQQLKSKPLFSKNYLSPAQNLIKDVLKGKQVDSTLICNLAGISTKDMAEAKRILTPAGMARMAMMRSAAESNDKSGNKETRQSGGHPSWIPKTGKKPDNIGTKQSETETKQAAAPRSEFSKEQREWAQAVSEVERTVNNIVNYKKALLESPEYEMKSLLNALNGGYVAPSSGGDAVANPNAVPTGRNMYAINADATPSEIAWDKAVSLVDATISQYRKQHNDYPKKVAYTFWSSEFIESEGTTIAQVLYMLGVEPVRDAFGRVSDIRLIPSETLGRPRIDVIVQTSGQFRDLAASRLSLITRAVDMASSSKNDEFGNFVSESSTEIERQLVEKGVSPKNAREISTQRVFGGVNGMYGTGLQEMLKSSDKWEQEKELAATYVNNMSTVYGSDSNWGEYQEGLLEAALHNTDIVIQPRQSNTWGALSLDHVFEFMGGMNLAVRDITGKEPQAYFADYRNRNKVKMQELKEAIGTESRSTIFNPAYIRETMKGKASSAAQITEVVTNTFAWNVLKPDVIDNEMWDHIYDTYVKDKYNLGVDEFFRKQNPAAMQEITAVMMETARKGMWKASEAQLTDIAALHTDLVKEFGPSGSGFAGSNVKLQDFIAQKTSSEKASVYKQQIRNMNTADALSAIDKSGMVLKKNSLNGTDSEETVSLNGVLTISVVLVIFIALLVFLRRRRKMQQ